MGEQPLTPRCRKCFRKYHHGTLPEKRGKWAGIHLTLLGPLGTRSGGAYKTTVKVRCNDCGHEWFTSDRALVRKYCDQEGIERHGRRA